MITRVRIFLAVLILGWGGTSQAAELLMRDADGRLWAREATPVTAAEARAAASEGVALVVTLDTWFAMEDLLSGNQVTTVSPGQDLILWTYFNRLDSLEVPFTDLIGRDMYAGFKLIGTLNLTTWFRITISDQDGGLVGLGTGYAVPVDAAEGFFGAGGGNLISGLEAVNNKDGMIGAVLVP